MMCEWNTLRPINVIRRNNDSVPDGWHLIHVDACIADYVQRMNDLGIVTVGCCCGHGLAAPTVLVDAASVPVLDQHGYIHKPFRWTHTVEHTIPSEGINPL